MFICCVKDQNDSTQKKINEDERKVLKNPCTDDRTVNKMTQRNNEQSNSREQYSSFSSK